MHQEGIRGLYKGLTATFMREIPGYVFFFGGYEICRTLLTPPGETKDNIGENVSLLYFSCVNDFLCYIIYQIRIFIFFVNLKLIES